MLPGAGKSQCWQFFCKNLTKTVVTLDKGFTFKTSGAIAVQAKNYILCDF